MRETSLYQARVMPTNGVTHGILADVEVIGMHAIDAACDRILRGDVRYSCTIDPAALDA